MGCIIPGARPTNMTALQSIQVTAAGHGKACGRTSSELVILHTLMSHSFLTSCFQNECFVPPADRHNITGQFLPSVHGYNGVNSVSLSGYPRPIDPLSIQTTKELPDEFPYNQDQNSGNPLGLGKLPSLPIPYRLMLTLNPRRATIHHRWWKEK